MIKYNDMSVEDRPIYKLTTKGSENLKDIELISLILKSGFNTKSKSYDLMQVSKQVYNVLLSHKFSIKKEKQILQDLLKIPSIKENNATKIIAVMELSARLNRLTEMDSQDDMTDPENIYKHFYTEAQNDKEHFYIVFLNNRDRAITKELISVGTINASIVHPREVFSKAIENKSATIIGVHNHPSGEISPSDADIKITKRLIEAGKLLGIEFYDHVIVGKDNRTNKDRQKYFSFKENYNEWWD